MKKELEFKLVKSANAGGGDRYETGIRSTPEHMVIYLPQYISRVSPGAMPFPTIKVTIEL